MKPIKLGEDLEKCVLSAIINGHVETSAARLDELSKEGRTVLTAVQQLRARRKSTGPLSLRVVLTSCVAVHGAESSSIRAYLRALKTLTAKDEVLELVQAVRDKQLLSEVINVSGGMLSGGSMDIARLKALIDRREGEEEEESGEPLISGADMLNDGFPAPPQGIPLRNLDRLTEKSGGLYGVWAIAGEPGVGKSTLACQIALAIGRVMPVLYYDFENGFAVSIDRLKHLAECVLREKQHAKKKLTPRTLVQKWAKRVYWRRRISPGWLKHDLKKTKAPALVIIDSLQKLPMNAENRRSGLDQWIGRFEALKQDGYHVLMISEKNRAQYGKADIGGFKESSEIEYTADFGAQLLADKSDDQITQVHIVKNRHRPDKGHALNLVRRYRWTFAERGATSSKKQEID